MLLNLRVFLLYLGIFFSVSLSRVWGYYSVITLAVITIFSLYSPNLRSKLFNDFSFKDLFVLLLPVSLSLLRNFMQVAELFQITHISNYNLIELNWYYYPVLAYFMGLLTLNLARIRFTEKYILTHIVSLLSLGVLVDFLYSLYKYFILSSYSRWDGSAANPNFWAMQGLIMVLLIYIYRRHLFDFSVCKLSSILNVLGLFSGLVAIVLSQSFATYLGFILLCLIEFLLPKKFKQAFYKSLTLKFCLVFIFLLISICLCLPNLYELIYSFNCDSSFIMKKVLPRIKIWQCFPDLLMDFNLFDYIWGLGFVKYFDWIFNLIKRNYTHVHNLYLHYFLTYGLTGLALLIASFIYFLRSKKKIIIYIVIYISLISVYDLAVLFTENYIILSFLLPIFRFLDNEKTL